MAMAARMPMIATTIISSMRVKPRWLRRLCQKLSIRSSLNVFEPASQICCQGLRLMAEGTLHLGRDSERRGARFGESDAYQRSCAGFDWNERGAADLADGRHDRLRRVLDKDESIDDLVAVGLLAVV